MMKFGEGIDFDQYLHPDDEAKIKPADHWRERVKEHQLNPQEAIGLRLPWNKAGNFRIRKGETTIHTGYNGHRKSMMLGYIQLGLIAQGEKCLSISLEMPPHITIDRQLKQFVGNEEPSLLMHDAFFEFVYSKLYLYDQIGTMKWRRVIAVCRYAIQELGVTQCFLDSLMKFGIKSKDHETQAEFVDEVTTLGKDTACHMHLVAHAKKPHESKESIPPNRYDVSGSGDISNMVDNVIIHHQNKSEDRKYDQLMIVDKQRNPEGDEAEPSFIFTFEANGLQFKPYSNTAKMSNDDWTNARFN